ncbi:MAG: thioredoxin family protein [Proteobacteria bacterium]|nr:thioredoxin family protein [Pseudomonadota bacterium]
MGSVKSIKIRAAAIMMALTLLALFGHHALAGTDSISPEKLPVKGMVTLVDLGAGQCIPCRMMAPILTDLRKKYRGKAVVAFVDVRFHPKAARRFGIRIIPTQIFYDRNGREVFRHEGYMGKAAIEHVFKRLGLK